MGLTQTRKSLSVALEASRQRGRQFGHTLLAGPAGVGKSSLARAIANELGTRLHHLMAPAVQDPELLIRQLLSLSPGEVVFLDEIHRLPTRAGEILYDALSQNELNLPLACDGWEQRALRIELPPFTLLGATTEPDDLPEPLLSRFVYHEQLGFYGAAELAELLRITANTQGVEVAEEAVGLLAAAARDTPRDALALLAVARDEAHSRGVARIDRGTARESLRRIGRDPSGLDTWGRAYLQTLREAPGGSLGLSNLASGLGLSRRTVQRVVEPFLIRRGWVRITARGRSVSTEPRTRAVRAA